MKAHMMEPMMEDCKTSKMATSKMPGKKKKRMTTPKKTSKKTPSGY